MAMKNVVGALSLVALSALFASACSSSSSDDDGGTDASGDARVRPDASRDDGSATVSCATAPAAEGKLKPPRIQKAACDQGTVASIVLAQTFTQIDEIISLSDPTCQACAAASEEGDASWGPIVNRVSGTGSDAVGTGDPINWGGCARALGFGAQCGDAFQHFQDCVTIACSTCQTSADSNACFDEVIADPDPATNTPAGACLQYVAPFVNGCPGGVGPVFNKCGTFPQVFASLCGPRAGVSVVDGGAGDAGDGGG
jgi:hypothetical protein